MNPALDPARAQVLAALAAGSGPANLTLRPPTLDTEHPQYHLPAALEAKLADRVAAGHSAEGGDYPRGQLIPTVVAPTAALALVDAGVGVIAGITWLVSDWHQYLMAIVTILSVIGFVVLVSAGLAVGYYVSRDPLRLSKAERRALNTSRHWQSGRSWTGAPAGTEQRRLVDVAAEAAARAAATQLWPTSYLDEQGIRIDLAAELDAIDERAHALALLDERLRSTPTDPAHAGTRDEIWAALIERCAALVYYADQLATLEATVTTAHTDPALEAQLADLLVGSIRDTFATERTLGRSHPGPVPASGHKAL